MGVDRYRKALVAAGGALAQVVGVLVTADDAGLLPASWRPWVAVLVGAATVLGVYRLPNAAGRVDDGRHELGRAEDPGRSLLRVMLIVGGILVLVLATVPASAAAVSRWGRPGQLVVPHVVSARDCDGTLWVAYGARVVSGREVREVLDDGLTGGLQLLDVSGRSQPHGTWITVGAGRGGEGMLRYPRYATEHPGNHYAAARVVREDRDRLVSGPVLITPGCPA
jgi:hypothetical protein